MKISFFRMSLIEPEFDRILAAESDTKMFNLSPTWTIVGLRDAYRRFCLLVHPDKHTDKGADVVQKASEVFVAVQAAYGRLMVTRNPEESSIDEIDSEKIIFNPFAVSSSRSRLGRGARSRLGRGARSRSTTVGNRGTRPQSTVLHRIFQTNAGEDNEVLSHSGKAPDNGFTSKFSSPAEFLGMAEQVDEIDPGTDLVSSGMTASTTSAAAAVGNVASKPAEVESTAATSEADVSHAHEHTHTRPYTYTHAHPHTHAPGHENGYAHEHTHPRTSDPVTSSDDDTSNTFVFGNNNACVRVQDVSFMQKKRVIGEGECIVVALRSGQIVSVPYISVFERDADASRLIEMIGHRIVSK
jgi:hypothetical protein